jgi:microcystin-dependent protein
MSSPFVAEIRMFAGNFAPTGWASCDGQLLPISQNTALFSLLGTFYGGDGKSTFALPGMAGNAPMHQGQGAGLSQRFLGETSGTDLVTLLVSEMPIHTHNVMGQNSHVATGVSPDVAQGLAKSFGGNTYSTQSANLTQMNLGAVPPAGGSLPHNNMQPFLCVYFMIAMQGIFPPRS